MILNNFKYLSLSILAVCFFASCTSDISDPEPVPSGSEVVFDISSITRSTQTTNDNITEKSFTVYADKKFNQESSSIAPSIVMDGTEVRYSGSSWTYTGTQYWLNDHTHSFVALHPYSDNGISYKTFSNSRLSFTYTLPSDYKNTTDILAATHRRKYSEAEKNHHPVSFRFSHILSLINIAVALDDNLMSQDESFQFHKLELSGIKTTATFNVAPASLQTNPQTDDRVIEVTDHKGEAKLTIEFIEPKIVKNHGGSVSFFDDKDALIMLPQAFPADSQAQIILTYTKNDETQPRQISSPLQRLEWEFGKGYTYKLALDRTGLILGTTTITDWNKKESSANADAIDPE